MSFWGNTPHSVAFLWFTSTRKRVILKNKHASPSLENLETASRPCCKSASWPADARRRVRRSLLPSLGGGAPLFETKLVETNGESQEKVRVFCLRICFCKEWESTSKGMASNMCELCSEEHGTNTVSPRLCGTRREKQRKRNGNRNKKRKRKSRGTTRER